MIDTIHKTDAVLKGILSELRSDVSKQRCIIESQGGTIIDGIVHVGGLGLPGESHSPAKITFLNEGNPVKSFYTIIVNGTYDQYLSVSINEPNFLDTALRFGNGLIIPSWGGAPANPWLILPDVAIQYLEVNISPSGAGVFVPINSVNLVNTFIGGIWIHAWTLPEYSNITE